MSCGQIVLKELGINVTNYFASEIEPNAIKTTLENFPNTKQIGNVMDLFIDFIPEQDQLCGFKPNHPFAPIQNQNGLYIINEEKMKQFPKIDLLFFGSPCRSLSKATAGRKDYNNGLDGVSWLFYPCNAILQWIKKYNNPDVEFMVENVDSNNKEDLNEISTLLGVQPVMIDSNLFSAQDRKRNYWTNINIPELPKENKLVLQDILDKEVDESFYYTQDFDFHGEDKKVAATLHMKGHDILKRVNSRYFKSPTLTSCRGGNLQKKVYDNGRCRKLTPNEYRKLQTIPDWYIMDLAKSHIYNMCGDGWTIEVIKHIFKGLKVVHN
jgi:DNA (cytosine-5)-methyltransferase 3A